MRKLFLCSVVFIFATLSVATTLAGSSGAPNPAHPWEKDQALLDTINKEVGSGGIRSVEPHVRELESAISGAKLTWVVAEEKGAVSYTLVDGPQEALVAATMATMAVQKKDVVEAVSVENPYPEMSLHLGSYYNEVGRPDDALRVLNAGLSLFAVSGFELGQHRPYLLAEKGAALSALKRWQDALADYEEGLKTGDLGNSIKALLERGRGLVLTELGRLDDAEAAYNLSLKHEPGNAHALHELDYIAHLRAGAAPTSADLISLQKPPTSPSDAPH